MKILASVGRPNWVRNLVDDPRPRPAPTPPTSRPGIRRPERDVSDGSVEAPGPPIRSGSGHLPTAAQPPQRPPGHPHRTRHDARSATARRPSARDLGLGIVEVRRELKVLW